MNKKEWEHSRMCGGVGASASGSVRHYGKFCPTNLTQRIKVGLGDGSAFAIDPKFQHSPSNASQAEFEVDVVATKDDDPGFVYFRMVLVMSRGALDGGGVCSGVAACDGVGVSGLIGGVIELGGWALERAGGGT
ncbi:hypothetical protein C8R46DRAFT_1203260 [Mycena filopes]|nr:hypothetical protein C8R46DRAFT_1203260 [Mycena filopes]